MLSKHRNLIIFRKMKCAITILITVLSLSFTSNAQHKGVFKWLGSTAQDGGGFVQNMYLDTPANTYTLYSPNTAKAGFDPICTTCPTFKEPSSLYYVYRTYDSQHNLVKKSCVKAPDDFIISNQSGKPTYHERTSDGHFIYGGMGPNYHFILCKADSFGTLIWKDSFDIGAGNGIGFTEKLSNGHYIFYGTVNYANGLVDTHYGNWNVPDAFLIEVDTLGTVHWSKVLGGSDSDHELLVKERSNGIYLMASTRSTDFNAQLCAGQNQLGNVVVKISNTGDIGCSYRYYRGLRIKSAIVEPNDDLVLFSCGPELTGTNPMNPNKRFQISKIDSNGNQIWWKQYGFDSLTSNTSTYDFGMIKNPLDDGYILWGGINNDGNKPLGDIATPTKGDDDIWLIFLDKNGDLVGQLSYGGSYLDLCDQIVYYPHNNSFLLQGYSKSGTGDFVGGHFFPSQLAYGEAFLSEIIYWPNAIDNATDKLLTPLVSVYPNPSTRYITISFGEQLLAQDKIVKLTHINGQLVAQFQITKGQEKYPLDLGELAASNYILSVHTSDGLEHSEQIIIRQ